jgi:hypothetical protein
MYLHAYIQGFYNFMGIQELTANTFDEYISIAIKVGRDK